MKEPWLYPDMVLSQTNLLHYGPEAYLEPLNRMQVRRIWIWQTREKVFFPDPAYFETVKRHIEYFHANGFEVGVWTTSLGFGEELTTEAMRQRAKNMTRLRSIRGKDCKGDAICPTDEDFCRTYQAWIRALAALKPDLLMLDDEHCLSIRPGIGCFCDRHMQLLSDALGEELVLDELPERIFTGGQNRYRDAWYQVMGDTLREFFGKVRAAADEVDPDLRIGICGGYTSWDFEGLDLIEMSKILAGKNEPFFRLTGAPYWVTPMRDRFHGQKLCSVIECARMQHVWTKGENVEIFTENDCWPRPCFHCPASLSELFDFAMQADGVRPFKYVLEYRSAPDYETNYLEAHVHNIPQYAAIHAAFEGKRPAGVRIFHPMHTIRSERLPEHFIGEKEVMRLFFSMSAAMLSGLGIATCYDGEAACGAAFGNEAEGVPVEQMPERMILDFAAAKLLSERGVDVGFTSYAAAPVPGYEIFQGNEVNTRFVGDGAPLASVGGFYRVSCKEGAEAVSTFRHEEDCWTAAYTYSNGTTQFLVFTFDAEAVGESSSVMLSYDRQQLLLDFTQRAFPYIAKHPDVYTLCAENGAHRAVLFENLSLDPIFDFAIELDKPCASFSLRGGEGVLAEDRRSIRVTTEFTPSSALLLELEDAPDTEETV